MAGTVGAVVDLPVTRIRRIRDDYHRLQVWSMQNSGTPLAEVQHPNQTEIYEFALSDDGQVLAAFPHNGNGIVWDLNEKPPREYPLPNPVGWPTDPFFNVDGKLLIVAHAAGIDICDWAAGQLVRTVKYPGAIVGLARHPDGKHLATVNANGTVYVLRVPELSGYHE